MAVPLDHTGVHNPHREPPGLGTARIGNQSHHHLIFDMPVPSDHHYLEKVQYKDAHNLEARIHLHQRFSTNPYGWFRWMFDQFDLPADAKILEIGCGQGSLWAENLARLPNGWRVTLSDFSPGMVAEAKTSTYRVQKQFRYVVSNAMVIPFPRATFDAVIANHMLYHVPDRMKALNEVNRVLKTDGCLYASTIGENHLLELHEITANFARTAGNYYSPALDPSGFTLENGAAQLEPFFEQVEVRYYPDALVITNGQPLIAYILSMIPQGDSHAEDDDIAELSRSITRQIDQNGSIYIQKCSGLFVGKKRGLADE